MLQVCLNSCPACPQACRANIALHSVTKLSGSSRDFESLCCTQCRLTVSASQTQLTSEMQLQCFELCCVVLQILERQCVPNKGGQGSCCIEAESLHCKPSSAGQNLHLFISSLACRDITWHCEGFCSSAEVPKSCMLQVHYVMRHAVSIETATCNAKVQYVS